METLEYRISTYSGNPGIYDISIQWKPWNIGHYHTGETLE